MKISEQEIRIRLCNVIRDCVMSEVDKLRSEPENCGMLQAVESVNALERLIGAVDIKNHGPQSRQYYCEGQLDVAVICSMQLTTIDEMLDACFSSWREGRPADYRNDDPGQSAKFIGRLSLRQSLNIATGNPFNFRPISFSSGTWGPFFGKTNALVNVEQILLEKDIERILKESQTTASQLNKNIFSIVY